VSKVNIQQLRYVLAIADNGSFREAAKIMSITQPSLSHGVKELEAELSQLLFTRTNRGAVLTKEGQEFYRHAEKIVNQIDRLQENFSNELQSESLTLSNQYFEFTARVVQQVLAHDPTCKNVHVLDKTMLAIIDDVTEFRSELGIIGFNTYENEQVTHLLKQKKLGFKLIKMQEKQVFVRIKHPLAQKPKITQADLLHYPRIRLIETGARGLMNEEATQNAQQTIETTDKSTLEGILKRTNGYALGSQLFEPQQFITGLELAEPNTYSIYLIKRVDELLSTSAKCFLKEMTNIF
jgi:DNA-binding transcriptional LysR family regulator